MPEKWDVRTSFVVRFNVLAPRETVSVSAPDRRPAPSVEGQGGWLQDLARL